MTVRIFRKLLLTLIFIAGVGSIMATEPTSPDFYFEDINLSPQYRCSGTDAQLQWSLNQPASVIVEQDNEPYDVGRETKLALRAAELDAGPNIVRFKLNILENAPYIEHGEIELTTIRGMTRWVEPSRWPGTNSYTGVYLYRFDQAKWDPRMRAIRLVIAEPTRQQCSSQDGQKVHWQVEHDPGEKFSLGPENRFQRKFEPPVPVTGEWTFVADPGEWPSFKGKKYPPDCLPPRVEFTVVCTDEPASK